MLAEALEALTVVHEAIALDTGGTSAPEDAAVHGITSNSRGTMWVALDTTILRKEGGLWLQLPQLDALIAYLRKEDGRLLIAETAWQEYEKDCRGKLSKKVEEIIRDFLKYPEWRAALDIRGLPLRDEILARLLKGWEKAVASKLSGVFLKVPHDVPILEETVRRALAKERPFRGNDSGFKDTVIWLSIIHFVLRQPEARSLAFITEDTAFAADGKPSILHPDLAKDCEERVEASLFPSVDEFLKVHGMRAGPELDWLRARVTEKDFAGIVQAYYVMQGREAPLEALDELSPHQVRFGGPAFSWFETQWQQTYPMGESQS